MKFIIFLSIMLLFLFGLHFLFFTSLIHFFSISRAGLKTILYTAMVLLTFSFISSFFLLHWRENLWTIGYYKSAALWTGALIHFAVAVVIIWIIIGIGALAGYPIHRQALAVFFLSAAICGSVYGVWSSFHPVVRQLTVAIKNLPKNWEGKTIAQLSDIHLGYFYGKKFCERIVEQVNALKPDMVAVTGDILDGMGGDFSGRLEPINRISAPLGAFFVTGNHEYYVGIDRALSILKKTQLRILNNELVNIEGVEVIGVDYPGIGSRNEIANLAEDNPVHTARILLFHTPTNLQLNAFDPSGQHAAAYWTPDTTYALSKQLHIDLQLSGHTHHGQIFPFNYLTRLLF